MHRAVNLARVSFVHWPAVQIQEVLSKRLPREVEKILLQTAVSRCTSLLSSLECNSRKRCMSVGTQSFPLGNLYGELLLNSLSCYGMTESGLCWQGLSLCLGTFIQG